MNSKLKEIIRTSEPKLKNLSEEDSQRYIKGLKALAELVGENFLDIPHLPENRFSKLGLFYNIIIYDDETLYEAGNIRWLLVVYEVSEEHGNRSSFCPLRIDFDWDGESTNFKLIVNNHTTKGSLKRELISKDETGCFTEIPNYETVKLSELVSM